MRQVYSGVLALALLVCGTGYVQANPISGLFDTGVNASGIALPDGTIGDPHYSLISVPSGTTAIRVRTAAGGFPIPPYFTGSSLSAWIGPNNDAQVDGPVGNFTYRTTFSLAGYNPSTANIAGGWSSDNDGVKILLNGLNTGNPATSFTQFSSGFAPFTVSTGFLPGLNTLDFVIHNGGGPTALRVEMSGTAGLVPEPETYAMLLAGLGLMGFVAGRRSRIAA